MAEGEHQAGGHDPSNQNKSETDRLEASVFGALHGDPSGMASKAFRSRARKVFLSGQTPASQGEEMQSRGPEESRSEATVIESLLKKSELSEPVRSEFREQMRERFRAGDFGDVLLDASKGQLGGVVVPLGATTPSRKRDLPDLPEGILQMPIAKHQKRSDAKATAADRSPKEPMARAREEGETAGANRPARRTNSGLDSKGVRQAVRTQRSQSKTQSKFPLRMAGVLLPVAAAAVFWFVVLGDESDNFGPVRVLNANEAEFVTIDGQSVSTRNTGELAKLLNIAEEFSTGPGKLELQLNRDLRMEVGPSSNVILASAELSNPADVHDFQLVSGTMHMITSKGYGEGPFVVATPDARIMITGTCLSIEIIPGMGTCVCVAEGEVVVESLRHESKPFEVPGRTTCFVFSEPKTACQVAKVGEPGKIFGTKSAEAEHWGPILAFEEKGSPR